MEATLHITGKKAMKVLGAACLATGVVALSAVVASGAAVGAVVEGFHSAKKTMQNILKKEEALASDEALMESKDKVMAEGGNEIKTADEIQAGSADIAGAARDES